MNSALASLTETYTDSENEEHHEDHQDLYSDPEEKQIKAEIVSLPKNPKQSLRLVSYNEDLEMHEDEEDDDHQIEEDSEVKNQQIDLIEPNSEDKHSKYFKKYGFLLPPEPTKTKTNPKLQEMVANISSKMVKNPDYDLNQYIQEEKKFRNPSIYDKLIQYCGINELGTNFNPETYDVSIYGPDSYYEELAKAQKIEMDKYEKQKKENVKTEIIVKEGKRTRRWDVADGKIVQPSSGASNKTTVINAFGILSKKPKI